jgi:hypothetical protein
MKERYLKKMKWNEVIKYENGKPMKMEEPKEKNIF